MKSRIKGIVVTGTGEASAPPDLITLHAGVSALAATVAEANRIAADAATRLIGSLTDSGIDRSDISTSNYTINSEYDWSGNERRFTGFRVNNNIQVHIHDLARSGQILDDAVAAAGDAITVNSLTFSIEDSAQMEEEARKRAWEDARKVAGQLAELAGRPLGKATSITERRGMEMPFPKMRLEAARAADQSTPVEAGMSSVTVSLEVSFEFAD